MINYFIIKKISMSIILASLFKLHKYILYVLRDGIILIIDKTIHSTATLELN